MVKICQEKDIIELQTIMAGGYNVRIFFGSRWRIFTVISRHGFNLYNKRAKSNSKRPIQSAYKGLKEF